VSHHPPVTALHATDDKENIEMIWCQQPVPKFYGTSVEAQVHGKRQLKLLNHGETYEMNSPNLLFKILPVPGANWVGTVNIRCLETGLVAELSYKSSHSFLGLGGNHNVIKGKIFDSSSCMVLYEVDGHWDRFQGLGCSPIKAVRELGSERRKTFSPYPVGALELREPFPSMRGSGRTRLWTVKLKDRKNGKVRVIYDATEVISELQPPILKDEESVWPTESIHIWSELSQSIVNKDWEKAKEAKQVVEERQRELKKEREAKGENWIPKHFVVSYNKEVGWNCSPIHNCVSAAPIIAL
ncbi:oxysterol-binding protein, partial [Trifolium pratense]